MNLRVLTFALLLLGSLQLNSQSECLTHDAPPPEGESRSVTCNDLIDPNHTSTLPMQTIKVAIHFIDIGYGNFYDGSSTDWNNMNGTTNAMSLINHSNDLWSEPHDNPVQAVDYLADTRIRLEVVPNYEDGVYFWDDLADYVPVPGVLNALFIDKYSPGSNDPFHLNGIACGIGSDCDNVKQYGWQSSENFGGPWHFWNYARLLNHEVAHVLGLNHAWLSFAECSNVDIDPALEAAQWNSGSSNTMNYVNCQCAFSPCQWSHMYSNIYDGTFSFTEVDCGADYDDIVVSQNTTWDQRVLAMADVIIEEGVTLTVECDVELNTDSRIIVKETGKLIVDGGTLTNLADCGSGTWKGVKVYGGNSDFDVKFTNGAVAENTSTAAVSMFAPEPWPQVTAWGNGIIHAENSTFNNVKRIVEMMAWTPSYNTSYIDNCVQNGGTWGVTNWNCYGVEITDNDFNGISNECIVTEVGQFLIEGNNFNSGRADVLFANVNPGFGTQIFSNEFNGVNTGVRALGTSFGQHEIVDNSFQTGTFDIFMDGDNNYLIESNDITSDFGIVSIENGNHSNEVFMNDISGNVAGLITFGDNGDYNFYRNCFNTALADVVIEGSVSSVVSDGIGNPANNCFTHGGNGATGIGDLAGNPDQFTYIEPLDDPTDCLDAVLADPNIIIEYRGDPDYVCGSAGSGFGVPNPIYTPCNPERNIQSMLAAIIQLNSLILQVQNNPNLSQWQKDWFISMYKRCLKKVKWWCIQLYFEDNQFEEVRDFVSEDPSNDAKLVTYTSYVNEGDLQTARSYLLGLDGEGEMLEDFKTVGLVNLRRIKKGKFFVPNSSQLNDVLTIAQKSHSYAGYAKALYYHLTGNLLSSDVPSVSSGNQGSFTATQDVEPIYSSIYPNPFREQLHITTSEVVSTQYTITSIMGQLMAEGQFTYKTDIDTSEWSQGLYIVTLKVDNEIISQEKLMLIK